MTTPTQRCDNKPSVVVSALKFQHPVSKSVMNIRKICCVESHTL